MENRIELFLEVCVVEKNISKNTAESYRRDLKHLKLFFNDKSIENLTHSEINAYFLSLKQNYSNSSIARKISALKGYYKFLHCENIIQINPMLKLENVKKEKILPNYLTKEEIEKLLECSSNKKNFNGIRDHAIIETLYATGMRVSEITSLKISDVLPLFKGVSHVTICGKGNRERVIIFTTKAIEALKNYIILLKNIEGKWLFIRRNCVKNIPITRQCIGKMLKKIALEAGIQPMQVYPHIIRHSFATHLLNAGMKINVIKELLGHKSISTTQIYTHVADDLLREMLENNHPFSNRSFVK